MTDLKESQWYKGCHFHPIFNLEFSKVAAGCWVWTVRKTAAQYSVFFSQRVIFQKLRRRSSLHLWSGKTGGSMSRETNELQNCVHYIWLAANASLANLNTKQYLRKHVCCAYTNIIQGSFRIWITNIIINACGTGIEFGMVGMLDL